MTKQETILTQKKLRVEAEIKMQQAETVEIQKAIHHLQIDLAKLDSLLYLERGAGNSMQQGNKLLEAQFMGALKVCSLADMFYSATQKNVLQGIHHSCNKSPFILCCLEIFCEPRIDVCSLSDPLSHQLGLTA